MTRKSKRELERAVDDLADATGTTGTKPRDDETLAELCEIVEDFPECDLERAITLLEDLESDGSVSHSY